MQIAVLNEADKQEARVALVPESVKKLRTLGFQIGIENDAGIYADAPNASYEAAGAVIHKDRKALLAGADILLTVNRPPQAVVDQLKPSAIVIGFLKPLDEPRLLEPMWRHGLTALAMELIPRITRAQAMDALSSMATVVGYKAVLFAADRLPKMFPLLMTAAGTISPARVLVIGAGVAGLQAIATAKRLGAVVEAYDVRAAAGEQVRSLGATFLEVDLGGIQTEDSGGYAKELSEEALTRGRCLIARQAKLADVVITTAQVPGRRAPLMLTEEAVRGMRPGTLVVDLAAASGGNCPFTRAGDIVEVDGVTIHGPLNLAASLPVHASQLYSRNLTALLQLFKEGVNLQDDILRACCVLHQGKALHPQVAKAFETMLTGANA
ncbi:MAG: Re/Si-specific NAD(P)(+) transhydrogenase subunit alpha [Parachlamydia sp.]|nr:Re/Si-specific NAD(P)(+) transhydrogenase subunit alpha [Parachlamydia sp.]